MAELLCKLDRTVLGKHASPDLVNLLEGALERVLDHQVITAAIPPPPAAADEKKPEPAPEPAKGESKNTGKGAAKPAKPAVKGKQAAPPPPPEEPALKESPPPPPPVADEYSERIDRIKSQCEKRIAESLQLEQYLKEQHDKADQDKAADFDARDQEFSRFWRYAGLPHVAPPLVLDKSKLQTAGLLDHRDILENIQTKYRKEMLDPPQLKEFSDSSAAPHYLAQTAANLNRAQTRADMISKCKKSIAEGSAFKWHTLSPDMLRAELKASRDREILNSKRMNGDQWDAERKVIERIRSKLEFVRNPRYEMQEQKKKTDHKRDPLLNRPKFGTRPANPKRQPALTSKQGVAFVCEPECITISDWKVGKAYEFPLQVRNVSHTLQQMRVVPLLSKIFHVSQASLPGPDSIIAPGMHASLRVRFTPGSLGNFIDTLKISTPLGNICVLLKAVRAAPALDLQAELDLGPEYVGGNTATKTVNVTAKNGSGTFRIMAAVDWVEGIVCAPSEGVVELPNGFSVQPAEFALRVGCIQQLTFSFSPTACGSKATTFVAVCDNCTVHEFLLKAEGIEPDAWIYAIDGERCSSQLPNPLTFPPTIPGSINKRTITIHNSGSAALPFRWDLEKSGNPTDALEATPSDTAKQEHSAAVARNPCFMVMPSEGVLRAGEEVHFEAVYAPDKLGRSSVSASFVVIPSAGTTTARSSRPQSACLDGAIVQQQLNLLGSSVRHPATVTPNTLIAPRPVPAGSKPEQTFCIRNPCRVPAHFTISSNADDILLSTESGVVAPLSNEKITVTVLPGDDSFVQRTFTCSIKHGCTHSIHVAASFTAPPVAHWLTPCLNFGALSAGSSSESILRVCNPCETAMAPWTASVQFHSVPDTSAAAELEFLKGCSGTVPAGDAIEVPVRCTVRGTGCMSGLLRLESNQQISFIPIRVETVAPSVSVLGEKDVLELGNMYVGVPVQQVIQVHNAARVAAKWQVRKGAVGQGCDSIKVKVEPSSGQMAAGETQEVFIQMVAQSAVNLDSLVVFDIEYAEDPLVVAIQGSAHGMSVQYNVEACCAPGTELQGATNADDWAKGETARLQAALDRKLVDFGSDIAVGDEVKIVMTVANDTGIEAMVDLRVLNFAAQDSGGAAFATCRRAETGGRRKGKMLLSDQHEVLTPFRVPTGNNILRNRRAKEVAESVLNNRGMAISITPPTATLPPFGTARFTLKLMSNMIGTYEDILECTVGTETPKQFIIRAGIIGSPVHLQKEASLVKGLFVRNSTQTRVEFGIVPKGVQVTRSVSVFNLCSFEVSIAFHLEVFERNPLNGWTTSQLHVQQDDSVALTIRENTVEPSEAQPSELQAVASAKTGPFSITPSSVMLKPGASERITITFASDETHTHEATLHGTQSLRYNASAVSVSLREATPMGSVRAYDNPGNADHPQGSLTEMFVRGAFHPHAAPPPQPLLPLKVSLAANCKPCNLLCDEGSIVQWCVHSTHRKQAAAFSRSFTLCNTAGCPLRFAVRTCGPFQVTKALPSVPQDDTRWTGATFFSSGGADRESSPELYFLPPNENIEISANFVKPSAHIAGALKGSSHKGELLIDFANGQVQELALRAEVLHPRLECKTEDGQDISMVDYGTIKVGCSLRKTIVLQNPTQVVATWTASVDGCEGDWPDGAFRICSAREGVLSGADPTDRAPAKHLVHIEFCPKTPGRHSLTVIFGVARGQQCQCSLKGLATFDEVHEPKRLLMGLP